ncbi:MAG: SIR2 family NAD-dependent protein deacylase [bacterium]|jgi:NAD-dependent deacetylase
MSLEAARTCLQPVLERGRLFCLTGAGVSAESGIPTFRGSEGFWMVGSRNYVPEELATWAFFQDHPVDSWDWYRHRFSACRDVTPNPGHLAFVQAEQKLGTRFFLVTQNVDDLHRRAGNSEAQTAEVHGSIRWMRCMNAAPEAFGGCPDELAEIPWDFLLSTSGTDVFEDARMRCGRCGAWMRPHVLWFDEYYQSSRHYRLEDALDRLEDADLLLIAGCSGTLFLANHLVEQVSGRIPMIIIDPERHEFVEKVLRADGVFVQGPGSVALPELLAF